MIPFFIASLPRSRTAWLANFLTYGNSYCFHEPMNAYSLEQYPQMLESTETLFSGVSDSMNSLVMEQLVDLFPGARIVVVRRSIEKVADSLKTTFNLNPWKMLLRMEEELHRIEQAYNPLVIDYEQFDAAKIWYYLFPGVKLNQKRLEMLLTFNVTVPPKTSLLKGIELMERAGGLLWPLLT